MLVLSVAPWAALALLVVWLYRRRDLYRASWRLPGPIAWPLVGNALYFWDIPNINTTIERLWLRHGRTVRFWLFQKFIVFLTDPAHLEYVMNAPQTADRGQVSSIIDDIIGRPGLFTSRGAEWRHHRKCLNPAMHFRVVNTYYPVFNRRMQELVGRIGGRADEGVEFDVFDYLDRTTLCMICETLFDMDIDDDGTLILDSVNNLMQNIGLKMYQPWYQIKPIFRLSKYYDQFQRSLRGIDRFIRLFVAERVRHVHDEVAASVKLGLEPDLLSGRIPRSDNYLQLCARLVEGNQLTFEEMIAETKTMLAGGFETTANTGSYIVLMLAMHPALQERVYAELCTVLPHVDAPLQAEHIPQLAYTDRFIKETLRLFPVVPLASRYAAEDARSPDGLYIPRGTEIILGIYYMQRDRGIWGADATQFDPERFGEERQRGRHAYAFVPFSAGFHHCIGAKYGRLVLFMFVAWLVRHFRFSTELRMEALRFRMDITLKLLNGHRVRAERREPY